MYWETAVVLRTDTSQFYKWISFAYTLFSLKNWNILGADTHAFENTYQSENVKHGLEFRKQGVEIVFFEKVFAKKSCWQGATSKGLLFLLHVTF